MKTVYIVFAVVLCLIAVSCSSAPKSPAKEEKPAAEAAVLPELEQPAVLGETELTDTPVEKEVEER